MAKLQSEEVGVLPIERDLKAIEEFSSPPETSVLSVYVRTDSNLEARLEEALRPIRAELRDDELGTRQLNRAADLVVRGFARLGVGARGAAGFACPDAAFLRIVPLPEPLVAAAYWGPLPHLAVLRAAVDEHERTVVALVDREHARLYRIFMGQIEEIGQLEREGDRENPLTRRGSRKGSASLKYGERNVERRHEWHVRRHLERVLAALRDKESLTLDRVLVGGGKETVHELLELMPRRVRARTRLISGLRVDANPAEVLARVMESQAQAEREAEEELLDSLLERDRGHAAIGEGPVSEAVSDSRVHTLVYCAGLEMQGSECERCGWLVVATVPESCPRCHGSVHPVRDLLERAARRVVAAGGRVEEVRGPAALTLHRRGGIAALLRYEPSVNGHRPALVG